MKVVKLKQLFSFLFDFVEKNFNIILTTTLLIMFVLSYLESLRWPLPGPKATHGILKGLGLLLCLALFIFKDKFLIPKNRRFNHLMVVFFLSYLISAVFSLSIEDSLLNLWYPFLATLIVFIFSKIKLDKKFFIILIIVSNLLITFTFAFSFFSLMFRYSVDNIYYFLFLDHRANHLLSEIRAFGKYVSLGPYLLLSPLCMIFLVKEKTTFSKKFLSIAVLLMTLLTAVISNNRIDILVFGIQIFFLLFLIKKRLAVLLMLPSLIIIWFGLFVTQTYFGFNLEQRILRPHVERDIETIDIRFTYWQTALTNFKYHPLFGTGPNTYNVVSDFPLRKYYILGVGEYIHMQDEGIGVHNIFFERLSDTGLFGFLAFVFLLMYLFKQDALVLLKLRHSKENFSKYLLISLSSWSWILYSLTDNGYGAQGFMIFFFLRAIINHYEILFEV